MLNALGTGEIQLSVVSAGTAGSFLRAGRVKMLAIAAKMSDREVERLLSNLRIGSFTSRDEQEVAGYAEVMETIFSAYEAIPFTENHIRQLHRDFLRIRQRTSASRSIQNPPQQCRKF